MQIDADGKRIAMVTGSAKGIGRAIALTLARSGVVPVLVDIDGEAAKKVVTEISDEGIETICFVCDVSNVGEVRRCFADVFDSFGAVDILVNNAGILSTTSITELDEAEWQRVMDINLKSAVFATQAALTYMMPRKWGRIINIASMAGRMGGFDTGCAYSVSKAGMIGLTMRVARRVASEGITVNAIAPGPTNTELVQGFTPEVRKRLIDGIPVGRVIEPERIGETAAFLASDRSKNITGQSINLNGGSYMN